MVATEAIITAAMSVPASGNAPRLGGFNSDNSAKINRSAIKLHKTSCQIWSERRR